MQEIFIFGDDGGLRCPGFVPDHLVARSTKIKIRNMLRVVSICREPACERWRQLGIDKKAHAIRQQSHGATPRQMHTPAQP